MKSLTGFCLCVILFGAVGFSQQSGPDNDGSDPYKPTFDRLGSLVTEPLPEWRFHADLPHPEDPSLDDSDWRVMNASPSTEDNDQNHWKGALVFRRWIEIPEKLNGYAAKGSRVMLDLRFGSDAIALITVFSNGSVLFHGDENTQQLMLLTEHAQPGQKYLIAARVDAGNVDTALFRSELRIEPPTVRPDPWWLREEIVAARPLIAAYPEGKSDREQQLSAAVKAIDFSALDKG